MLKIIFGRDNMETLGDKFCEKSALKFHCIFCDYNTSRKSSYDDHLLSAKHKKRKNDYNKDTKSAVISQKINNILVEPMLLNNFICSLICGSKILLFLDRFSFTDKGIVFLQLKARSTSSFLSRLNRERGITWSMCQSLP